MPSEYGRIGAIGQTCYMSDPSKPSTAPVVVVGAGLAGLVAANELARNGVRSVVADKGRAPGGRLATRRIAGTGGVFGRFDHGAQFFTVRSPDFAELVHEWRRAGVVREWCQGFRSGADGYPRYCAEGGMNTIAKFLAATADVHCNALVHAVGGHAGALSVSTDDGRRWESDKVLLTPPVPQSLALCENGWLPLPEDEERELRAVTYAPCLALLVAVTGASAVPSPGGLQLDLSDDPVFSFVGDNQAKGISEVGALTFHVNDDVSVQRFDDSEDDTRAYLLAEARRFLGGSSVLAVELKKWRYARPVVGHNMPFVAVAPIPGTLLLFGGDAFGEARIEGAALSGLRAAEHILATF